MSSGTNSSGSSSGRSTGTPRPRSSPVNYQSAEMTAKWLRTLEALKRKKLEASQDRSTWEEEEARASGRGKCEKSLIEFVRAGWHVLEPERKYIHSWHLDAVAEHLEAIAAGILNPPRLLLNIPPGSMKSLLVSVFFPAWIW